MIRIAKPSEFLRELSRDARLKFLLASLTFAGLVLPTALLMSLGFSERYALPLMLVAAPPFQYGAFCVLRWRKEVRTEEERVPANSSAPLVLVGHMPRVWTLSLESLERRAFAPVVLRILSAVLALLGLSALTFLLF